MIRCVALLALGLAAAASAAQPANSCLDSYWKDTLRCKVFPSELPQPNLGDVAPGSGAVPKFTRVWLDANPGVRCVDGTIPLMYVDKAICTRPGGCGAAPYGEAMASNLWMFTMPGGGSCFGEYCALAYADPAERGELGSATKPQMKNMEGIHDPDPATNPVFAGYNRVRVEKCSYDRYLGRTGYERAGGYFRTRRPDGTTVDYNLYHHGTLQIEEAFAMLEDGLEYRTWIRMGAATVPATETLPPLREAEVVLFVGHSGANHGLYQNIDNLAARLGAMPGFAGDVRALFDANFIPAVENESAFASSAPAGSDAYSGIASGTSSSSKSGPFTYDAESHNEQGIVRQQYDAWLAELDVSCLAAHGTDGNDWKCRDRHHVLLNHIATPFFQREDFTDPNPEHNDSPDGHPLQWAAEGNYRNCEGGVPCLPRLDLDEYRERVALQAQTLIAGATTRSELGRRVDPSGDFPTFFLWLPSCGKHDGAYDDQSFYTAALGGYTMRTWLETFMRAPRTGTLAWLIDGVADAEGKISLSQCDGLVPGKRRSVRR